jgi:predicted membrane protein
MRQHHHNPRSSAAGALIVIAIGVLLLLNQNGILRFEDIWRLWPMVLIIGGGVRMMQSGSNAVVVGGLMVSVGIVLELAEFHLIPYQVWDLWPVAIIAIGLLMLWRSVQPRDYDAAGCDVLLERRDDPQPENPKAGRAARYAAPEHLSIFGGGERRISGDFLRADVLALFGGYKLDLRKATVPGPRATVDAVALFGGVEIIVPENWNVIVKGVGIFGGYGDESHHSASGNGPELVVEGVALFGGVSIKN